MSNYVKNIAIVGAGGNQGRFIAEELVKGGKHNVSAITRANGSSAIPDGVTPKPVDYDDHSSLVAALTGQDVLIITMSVAAPPGTQDKLIDAATEAGVKIIVPNNWGYDFTFDPVFAKETLIGEATLVPIRKIEAIGKSAWIGVACGFWYEFSLGGGLTRFGFDINKREFIRIDDGKFKIPTSTWRQVGRGVTSLFSLKFAPEDENDKSATLEDFKNRCVEIQSFHISQNEMFESLKRVTKTIDADWKISQEESHERYAAALEMLKTGNRLGYAQAMYTRCFWPENGAIMAKLRNEVLGLSEEDLDEQTKLAVEFAKSFESAQYS